MVEQIFLSPKVKWSVISNRKLVQQSNNLRSQKAYHLKSQQVTKCPRPQLRIFNSTEASDRSFYPTFNIRLGQSETLLTIHRPKKVLLTGLLCRPLVPSPQSKCPKRTFILPQNYHTSVSNMLSCPLKYFIENKN